MKSKLIDLSIFLVSLLRRRKKYAVPNGKVLVNLGCGLRCLPGWVNIDGSLTAFLGSRRFPLVNRILYRLAGSSAHYSFEEFNKIIKTCHLRFFDLRKGVPLADSVAEVIYVSHFLEHINKKDGKHFLKECFRVLKKGGLLRVVSPDLDIAFKMYKAGEVERMLDLFFYTSEHYDFHMHKYNYNFELLKNFLAEAGFGKIEKADYRQGECPAIDFLDLYPEHSLYVEARKRS